MKKIKKQKRFSVCTWNVAGLAKIERHCKKIFMPKSRFLIQAGLEKIERDEKNG